MSERTIRHREDGPPGFTRFGVGISTEPGDEVTVDEDLAEELVGEKAYFEFVDDSTDADSNSGSDSDSDGEADGDDADGYEFEGEDAWFDDHEDYEARIDRVESGDVDDHLDTIADIETSDQVKDAIGVRRAEIEG